jgi:predicted O-methyltransferase YrrM
VRNPYFATPDAELYAGMIAERRPRAIVEVGAGFSTLVARRTIDSLGLDTRLVVVDPQPRTDVAGRADELVRERIEAVDPERLPLGADTILFIDSSHVVRARGDVPWLFNSLLPAAAPGTVVHVHDIFLPWDYPDVMRLRLYGEQYVLHALLSHTPRYRTLLAVHYLCRRHRDAVADAVGDWSAQAPELNGGSFWFEVTSEP